MKNVLSLLFLGVVISSSCAQTSKTYKQQVAKILTARNELNKAYQLADSLKKNQIINEASMYIFKQLTTTIFPEWYGTEWDYNGYSNVPKQGQIACGYFVSTTLKHIGFNLNRYKLAQQYSLSIVNSLCKNILSVRNNDTEKLFNYINSKPNQLYIVGLDNHVGFILKETDGIYFIHSSYLEPVAVIKEKARTAEALIYSNLFVLGHFSENKEIIKGWLSNKVITIKK